MLESVTVFLLKIEDNLKNEDDLKYEETLKNEDKLKIKKKSHFKDNDMYIVVYITTILDGVGWVGGG